LRSRVGTWLAVPSAMNLLADIIFTTAIKTFFLDPAKFV
jgi:hypothetical protein